MQAREQFCMNHAIAILAASVWMHSCNVANTHFVLQSGMRETHAQEIELGDMEGPVLTALISAMYGKLIEVPDAAALPLFFAADAYQVQTS